MKNQNYKFLAVMFLFIAYHFSPITATPIFAQSLSLGIYPPLLQIMIQPGKSLIYTYQLTNSGNDDIVLNSSIVPFVPEGENGNISLRGATSLEVTPHQVPRQIPQFSFENADLSLGQPFLLKANENKQIILRIKIPENAPEDDYYQTLIFSAKQKENIVGSTSQQAGALGTNILLTVSQDGQPIKKGEIIEFKLLNCLPLRIPIKLGEGGLNWCITDSFQKPEFILRVKNTGRTYWQPFGKITAKGLLGNWEQGILPENVLAHSIRQINFASPSSVLTTPYTLLPTTLLLGQYQAYAQFSLEEDGKGNILTANVTFVSLPIKAGLGILTGLILISIIKPLLKRKK